MTDHVIIALCVHPLLLQDYMIPQDRKGACGSRYKLIRNLIHPLPPPPTHKINVNEPDHNPRYFMPFSFRGAIWVDTLSSLAGHV